MLFRSTITFTETSSGCSDTHAVSVDCVTPTITSYLITEPTICDGTNGSISLVFTNITDGSYTINYIDENNSRLSGK